MNKFLLPASLLATMLPTISNAQSSVTISGVLDGGVTYVTNQHGGSSTLLETGVSAPNLLSFRGTEDLGQDTKALFELTSQIDLSDGTSIPAAGRIFDRTAMVGLSHKGFGSITLGNQYDFMFESLSAKRFDGAFVFGGIYDFRQGPFTALGVPNNPTGSFDFDRMAGATRVANSIKYQSPDLGPFSFGALYGFGEKSGSFSSNSTVSAGANYESGPVGIGVAYVEVKYPQLGNGHDGIRNFGVGAHYQFPSVLAMLLYTNTKNTSTAGQIDVYKASAYWDIAGPWATGITYAFMDGNDVLDSNHAHQVTLALQYHFSKRTTVYAQGTYQKAGGNGSTPRAWINGLLQADGASSTSSQALARVGLLVKF